MSIFQTNLTRNNSASVNVANGYSRQEIDDGHSSSSSIGGYLIDDELSSNTSNESSDGCEGVSQDISGWVDGLGGSIGQVTGTAHRPQCGLSRMSHSREGVRCGAEKGGGTMSAESFQHCQASNQVEECTNVSGRGGDEERSGMLEKAGSSASDEPNDGSLL